MHKWREFTIKQKILTFTIFMFLVVFVSVGLSFWVIKFSLFDFNKFLKHNNITNELVVSVKQESECFEAYMKNGKEDTKHELDSCIKETKRVVEALPDDINVIGTERFARTQAFIRAYHVYETARDELVESEVERMLYIKKLYNVYDMQKYLLEYAERLMDITIKEGNIQYEEKVPILHIMPEIVVFISLFLVGCICYLSITMHKTIIHPVLKLVEAAKKITENDFYIEDVIVENKDEIGDLVHSFNKMKFATGEYITALEEQRKTKDLLYEKELERLEMQKQLDAIHLELLKNQIQPHFLFNTLNVIAGMANLEDAHTTEKMTKALSNLFRYNLKTPDIYVALSKEIKVLEDYMYLQQMRFGSRILYEIFCEVDQNDVLVPSFIFQPLAENAIIHGIGPKEEGGKIFIHIWEYQRFLYITFNDDGVGMEETQLEELRNSLQKKEDNSNGIGLKNVYRRINMLYKEVDFDIFSRRDEGTLIKIRIPLEKERDYENSDS